MQHIRYLEASYGVGPHTISFPRLRPAYGVSLDEKHLVSDHDFKRVIAILRLSVPYTGLILTAQTESELTGVLGHEIAHVTQRHIARSIVNTQRTTLLSLAGLILGVLAASRAGCRVAVLL